MVPARQTEILGVVGAVWGLAGLVGLLVFAVYRLGGVVVAGLEYPWAWQHVAVAVANAVFMAWSEGWRGFQQSFSPRVAARLTWLRSHPSAVRVALSPLFAMGYFGATRERLIGIYGLTAGIAVLIVVVHILPQPWRAALDIGVVIGLSWGIVSTLACAWRVFNGGQVAAAPGVP